MLGIYKQESNEDFTHSIQNPLIAAQPVKAPGDDDGQTTRA
jgi:hypothetical protein